MKICVVSINYPMYGKPESGAFVANLVQTWVRQGIGVEVIAPMSPRKAWIRGSEMLKDRMRGSRGWSEPSADRPVYVSFSQATVASKILQRISRRSLVRVVRSRARRLNEVDVYYGKFVASGGLAVSTLPGRCGLDGGKAVADLGESRLSKAVDELGEYATREIMAGLDGVVCVSQQIADGVSRWGIPRDRICVAPNAPDLTVFEPGDSTAARAELGLPRDMFLVAFAGHFIPRKGPLRVLRAIESISGCKGVFLGQGNQTPRGPSVAYRGVVPHREVAGWLRACDAFVLPTRAEGSCNAIWEAMGCGIPVISSDIPEVREQVPERAGLLVDGNSVEELRKAIICLMHDDDKCHTMGEAARKWVEERGGIDARARRIADFMSDL